MGNANSQVESDSDVEEEEEEEEEEDGNELRQANEGEEVDDEEEGGEGQENGGTDGEDDESEEGSARIEAGMQGNGSESDVSGRQEEDDVAQKDQLRVGLNSAADPEGENKDHSGSNAAADAEKDDAPSRHNADAWTDASGTPKERGRSKPQGSTVLEQEPEQSPWQHSSQPPLEPQESIGFSPLDSTASAEASLGRIDRGVVESPPDAKPAGESQGPGPLLPAAGVQRGPGGVGTTRSSATASEEQGSGGQRAQYHPTNVSGGLKGSKAARETSEDKPESRPEHAATASNSQPGVPMRQQPVVDGASLEQLGDGTQPPGSKARPTATEPASAASGAHNNLPEAATRERADGFSDLRSSRPERMLAAAAELSSHPFLQRRSLPCELVTEFHIVRHGQASHNVGHLIGGRSHTAPLTELGTQQAHVLGRYLSTYTNLHFDAIYSSPIERALQTAYIVCEEMGVPQEAVQIVDALQELSQGQWEQQPRKAIYLEGVLDRMTAAQPDFRAPGGESQRQVEFRMVEFLNNVLFARQHLAAEDESMRSLQLAVAEKVKEEEALDDDYDEEGLDQVGGEGLLAEEGGSRQAALQGAQNAVQLQLNPVLTGSKGSINGVYGLTDVATDAKPGGRLLGGSSWSPLKLPASPQVDAKHTYRVAVFSHGTAIRCLLRGIMAWDPHLTHKVSIDNTSITVLKHTTSKGWHLVKLNDTTHMALARGPIKNADRS